MPSKLVADPGGAVVAVNAAVGACCGVIATPSGPWLSKIEVPAVLVAVSIGVIPPPKLVT